MLTHGHLFEMGGFTLIDPDLKDADPKERNETVLTIDYFRELVCPNSLWTRSRTG